MDVICERCSTEYEFDDALVSEQGTPVKCTNCGHQFKVFRTPDPAAPEQWIVRTVDGRQLEFRALRELREAIAEGRVDRDDVLTAGNTPPRRLGSISELEPFFVRGGMTMPGFGTPPPRARSRTPQGLGVMPPPSRAEKPAKGQAAPAELRTTAMYSSLPGQRAGGAVPSPRGSGPGVSAPAPVPAELRTTAMYSSLPGQHGPGSSPLPVPVVATAAASTTAAPTTAASTTAASTTAASTAATAPSDPQVITPPPPGVRAPAPLATQVPDDLSGLADIARTAEADRAMPEADSASQPDRAFAPGEIEATVPAPPASAAPATDDIAPSPRPGRNAPSGVDSSPQDSVATPTPGDLQSLRSLDDLYDEPRFSVVPSKRAGPARWIVGFFLGGMMLFAAVALGRKYVPLGTQQPAVATPDERTTGLLHDGERRMLDGDLDGAKEQFAKASALADKDPRVAASMAYLAMVSADIPWLRIRLLAPDDPDRDNAVKVLALAVDQAQKAANRAQELAAGDAMVTRCRIDALRLAGDRDGARRLVDGIASASGQPENAFVLAALELAEDKPDWQTVIERLRVAASAEQSLGRARSMLIFALARSGDGKGAKAEFDKLAALARPHPLISPLRAFLSRAEADQQAAPDAGAEDAGPDVSEAIRLGKEALKKGQFAEAEEQLKGALEKKPGDPEILTALAEVARGKGNPVEAARLFDQALGEERSYLPALAALADMKWELGDRPTAVTLYKQILDKGGESSPFAARAKTRIAKASASSAGAVIDDGRVPDDYVAPESLVGKPPPRPGAPVPPSEGTPTPVEIDTSDLPGFNKP